MSREIKFRAWDKKLKRYSKVTSINFKNKSLSLLNYGSSNPIRLNDGLCLEQFTGLEDKNGKDIYEGDIIQYSQQIYEYLSTGIIKYEAKYIGTVVKNNGCYGILISRISYKNSPYNCYSANDFVSFYEFDDSESDMELKGNVHDNSELLEES